MNRRVLRLSAILGAAAVTTLAVAPAFAATNVSSASAQALQLSIANNSVASQIKTATNDGATEDVKNPSTIPDLVSLIPGNNALKAAVAVQQAKANADGTSYACAGLAGPASDGLVTVGSEKCNIDGAAFSLDLGSLNLDLNNLLGGNGAISGALGGVLTTPLLPITNGLTDVVNTLTGALAATPLNIKITGGLSAVEASCTANPEAAHGATKIVDTTGGNTIPIALTIPGQAPIVLAPINVDLPAKPGGTDVLVDLSDVTAALMVTIQNAVTTLLQGQLAGLAPAIKAITDPLQNAIIAPLVQALQPALQALSDNLLKITVNDVTPGDGGKSVKATALKVSVLPAIAPVVGASLVDVTVGKVSCGPNEKVASTPEANPTPVTPEDTPDIPTVVDSGVAGNGDNSARTIIAATAALMLLAGTAGLVGYRRMLSK